MPASPRLPRDRLSAVERLAVAVLDGLNLSSSAKDAVQWAVRNVSARWVRTCTRNLVTLAGLEHVATLAPPAASSSCRTTAASSTCTS